MRKYPAVDRHSISYTPLIWLVALIVLLTIAGISDMQKPNATEIQTGESCPDYCAKNPASYDCKQLAALKRNDRRSDVKAVLEERLKDYQADKKVLSTNCLFQLVFVLLGLLVVTGSSVFVETPIAGIKLPRVWMFYIVPLALMYFWLEFGFLTDKMIQTRHEAWLLLEALSTPDISSIAGDAAAKSDHLTRQMARLFEDGAYVDGWFVAFRGCEHVIDTTFRLGTNVFWSLVYGSLLGLTHAGAMFLSHVGNARYLIHRQEREEGARSRYQKLLSILGCFLPYIIIALMLASHIQFFWGGDNPNWMQLVIAMNTIMFGWLLIFTANSASTQSQDAD